MKKIETENLVIIACDQEILELAIAGNQQLSDCIQATVPDNWTEFGARALQYSLEKLKSSENEKNWWSYLPIYKADNMLIGLCGYKGQPNEHGMVEFGYEIKADYRNKGFATELAKALIKNAFDFEEIKSIQAHTLGEKNASTQVLVKCGFQKIDEISNKELGMLWKWELKKTNN
jgi:[ribosomal protein S5]-alanine N-acetyltransferase